MWRSASSARSAAPNETGWLGLRIVVIIPSWARGGHVAGWLSRQCIRGGEPAAEFVVQVSDCGDADTVGEQRVESGRGLQPIGRWRCRQDQSEVDPAGGARLDHRELLTAAEAQVALLGGDV